MRIAQVAPLYESVPPTLYGGTERIVSYLTEELVELGHDVTLFASGDSTTRGAAGADDAAGPQARRQLRRSARAPRRHARAHRPPQRRVRYRPFPHRLPALSVVARHRRAARDHAARAPGHSGSRAALRAVRGRAGRVDLRQSTAAAADCQLGRDGLPRVAAEACVEAGGPRDYLAFLGRISPEKGIERAVEIARGAGLPLRVAAKIDRADREYYDRDVAPLFHRRDRRLLRRDWRSRQAGASFQARVRCCSRSTGKSRSVS